LVKSHDDDCFLGPGTYETSVSEKGANIFKHKKEHSSFASQVPRFNYSKRTAYSTIGVGGGTLDKDNADPSNFETENQINSQPIEDDDDDEEDGDDVFLFLIL
jgi:hypothetical protein